MSRVLPAVAVAICALAGCAQVDHQLRASPAKDSGFLDTQYAMKEDRTRFPFNRVYISPSWKENRGKYTKVIIAPVDMHHIARMDWWTRQSAKTKEQLKDDVRDMASYMHGRFEEAVRNDPSKRFTLAKSPGPGTVVLETAIVELVPSKAFMNAAVTAGGFFVPGVGSLATFGKGSIAIEARVRDSRTGELFAQMADREENKTAAVDIAGMTSWYDGAKDAMNEWANQFVELANTDPAHKVADSSPLTLVTW